MSLLNTKTLDYLIGEFRKLWEIGAECKLSLVTKCGAACGNMEFNLVNDSDSFTKSTPVKTSKKKHIGPSQLRRRARRALARADRDNPTQNQDDDSTGLMNCDSQDPSSSEWDYDETPYDPYGEYVNLAMVESKWNSMNVKPTHKDIKRMEYNCSSEMKSVLRKKWQLSQVFLFGIRKDSMILI